MNFDPILEPDELKENNKKKEELLKLLRSRECILMAGAGCSAGIHSRWAELMQLFFSKASALKPDFPPFSSDVDYLEYADQVKTCIGDERYYHLIWQQYKPKGHPYHQKHHELLCALPFRGITTTNYDHVLESAISGLPGGEYVQNKTIFISPGREKATLSEYLTSLNEYRDIKQVFHIHGSIDDLTSIVLCGQEYREKYGFIIKTNSSNLYQAIRSDKLTEQEFDNLLVQHGMKWTAHRKIIWSLFATRRLLFLGFSMDDPYFKRMLETVSDDLHTYDMANHFLAARITRDTKNKTLERARVLQEEYGVATVFFYDDDTYQGLVRFIHELSENVKLLQPDLKLKTQPIKEQVGEQIQDDVTARLLKLSKERSNDENK